MSGYSWDQLEVTASTVLYCRGGLKMTYDTLGTNRNDDADVMKKIMLKKMIMMML